MSQLPTAAAFARSTLLLSVILLGGPVLSQSYDKKLAIKDVIHSAVSDAVRKHCVRTDDEVRIVVVSKSDVKGAGNCLDI